MRYRAVLLDADDTVFDFREAERRAFRLTLTPFGLTDDAHVRMYHEINKGYWKALERGEVTQAELRVLRFEDFLRQYGVRTDAVKIAASYSENLSRQAVLIDGALETVRRIAARLPIAIVTNGIAQVQRGRMARSEVESYIRELVISEEVGSSKPDPGIVYEALRRLGVKSSEALLIGDSTSSDVPAGNAAGVDVCWYNPKGSVLPSGLRAEYEIRDIREAAEIALG